MIKIKKAGDFELGFNCMTRLYMDGYDEEILNDMIKVCDEYLKWFSQETIYSSLFDLVRERHFYQNGEKVPEEQKERYESLIMALARQGICREKKNSQNREERIIILFGIEAGFLDSFFGKEKDFDLETFYWWVIDNNLNEEVEIKQVKADETLPIKKSFLPTFDKLCKYMIRYSYGRHSYMPSTSRDFVKANKELISDAALEDIICYLNKRNMNIPENEDFIIKNDSENWLYMQEELESE